MTHFLRRNPLAAVGAALLAAILLGVLAAPLLAPGSPIAVAMAQQFQPPSWAHPLGTDFFGRDILSRVLHGGQATLAIDWSHAITNGLELRTTADMFASDGYYLSPTLDPNQVQDSYAKFNMRLAVGDPDRRWEIAVLGKNLFDERTVSMGVQTPLAFSPATFGAYSQANVVDEGRTFALQGRFSF